MCNRFRCNTEEQMNKWTRSLRDRIKEIAKTNNSRLRWRSTTVRKSSSILEEKELVEKLNNMNYDQQNQHTATKNKSFLSFGSQQLSSNGLQLFTASESSNRFELLNEESGGQKELCLQKLSKNPAVIADYAGRGMTKFRYF